MFPDILKGKKFVAAICQQVTAKNRVCGRHMGYIDLSRPNTAVVRCRPCKLMEAWDVGADGRVLVTPLAADARIKIYDETVILRERKDG